MTWYFDYLMYPQEKRGFNWLIISLSTGKNSSAAIFQPKEKDPKTPQTVFTQENVKNRRSVDLPQRNIC